MRLLLLLVAIYSLIFYQHYKLTKSKALLSGDKVISVTEKPYKFSASRFQAGDAGARVLTTGHSYSSGYTSNPNQWKPQMVGFILPAGRTR